MVSRQIGFSRAFYVNLVDVNILSHYSILSFSEINEKRFLKCQEQISTEINIFTYTFIGWLYLLQKALFSNIVESGIKHHKPTN